MIKKVNNEAAFAISLARSAGTIIRDNFPIRGAASIEIEWKADMTPLTKTDEAVHQLVVSSIRDTYPQYSLISEEETNKNFDIHKVLESDYVWVCDPIDGTLAFSSGVPTSTFSLALTCKGDVVLGVVYDPFLDRIFTATKGNGAFMNDLPIRTSQLSELRTAIVGVEGLPNEYDGVIYHYLRDKGVGAKPLSLGSITYSGCMVALGSFAGVVFGRKKPWDVAAIKIIVEEAGGRATNMEGNDQRYDEPVEGFVASNAIVHHDLISMIMECRKCSKLMGHISTQ